MCITTSIAANTEEEVRHIKLLEEIRLENLDRLSLSKYFGCITLSFKLNDSDFTYISDGILLDVKLDNILVAIWDKSKEINVTRYYFEDIIEETLRYSIWKEKQPMLLNISPYILKYLFVYKNKTTYTSIQTALAKKDIFICKTVAEFENWQNNKDIWQPMLKIVHDNDTVNIKMHRKNDNAWRKTTWGFLEEILIHNNAFKKLYVEVRFKLNTGEVITGHVFDKDNYVKDQWLRTGIIKERLIDKYYNKILYKLYKTLQKTSLKETDQKLIISRFRRCYINDMIENMLKVPVGHKDLELFKQNGLLFNRKIESFIDEIDSMNITEMSKLTNTIEEFYVSLNIVYKTDKDFPGHHLKGKGQFIHPEFTVEDRKNIENEIDKEIMFHSYMNDEMFKSKLSFVVHKANSIEIIDVVDEDVELDSIEMRYNDIPMPFGFSRQQLVELKDHYTLDICSRTAPIIIEPDGTVYEGTSYSRNINVLGIQYKAGGNIFGSTTHAGLYNSAIKNHPDIKKRDNGIIPRQNILTADENDVKIVCGFKFLDNYFVNNDSFNMIGKMNHDEINAVIKKAATHISINVIDSKSYFKHKETHKYCKITIIPY